MKGCIMLRHKIPFGGRDVTDAEWQDLHLSCCDMLSEAGDGDCYVLASGDKYVGIGFCLFPIDESWKPLCSVEIFPFRKNQPEGLVKKKNRPMLGTSCLTWARVPTLRARFELDIAEHGSQAW